MKFLIKQVSMSYEAFVYVTEFIFEHKQVATTELVQELVYVFNEQWKHDVWNPEREPLEDEMYDPLDGYYYDEMGV